MEEAKKLFLECEQIYAEVYGQDHSETLDAARRAQNVGQERDDEDEDEDEDEDKDDGDEGDYEEEEEGEAGRRRRWSLLVKIEEAVFIQ